MLEYMNKIKVYFPIKRIKSAVVQKFIQNSACDNKAIDMLVQQIHREAQCHVP